MLARVLTILMAMLLAPVAASGQTETVYYFHTDAVGSVRMITDANGQEVARHDYLPFGEEWAGTSYSNISNQMKYAGLERDAETGLDYALARYYRQQSGRFTQADDPVFADPFDSQSAQLYGYAYNNPLAFIDPTGHAGKCIDTNPIDCRDPWDEAVKWALELEQFVQRILQQVATTAADAVTQANQSLSTGLNDCRTGAAHGARCKALLDSAIAGNAMLAGALAGVPGRSFISAFGRVVPVPKGWVSRVATSGKGIIFQKPGSVGNANMIRIMEPTTKYQAGYVRYYDSLGQPLDAFGKPGSQATTHIPLDMVGGSKWPW